MSTIQIKKYLKQCANADKAKILQRFFKTGPGEYGEGDIFYGITVPDIRQVAQQFIGVDLSVAEQLLHSKIHEERFAALLILIAKFQQGSADEKTSIYRLYLHNTHYINNWDLVDLSSPKIMGAYLFSQDRKILYKLARSKNLWDKRIAIIATLYFIKYDDFKDTLQLVEIFLNEKHDLMHKACGWMLREVGKKNQSTEEKFLQKHYKHMPRTMLRYAIERFPETLRQKYLKQKI